MKRLFAMTAGMIMAGGLLSIASAQQPAASASSSAPDVPPVVHSAVGDHASTADGLLTISNIGKRQNFRPADKATYDTDIFSPKSAAFHPDGTRFYVNSLEGCKTVVYSTADLHKVKTVEHKFPSGTGELWAPPSGFYPWTHYPTGASKAFSGKPVEMTFSHGGRYLWVPYYRRTFDINAQDPSAIAVIDTRGDSIVRMFETGSLPKMVSVSNSGNLLAITHWGDNTVGFIDISSDDANDWHHLAPVAVGQKLKLNYSLTTSVNRDSNSGYLLRGTAFLPGDRYMLIGCMAGSIAVVDVEKMKHLGFINNVSAIRHLVVSDGDVIASSNRAGMVYKIPVDSVLSAIEAAAASGSRSMKPQGWSSCKVGSGARTLEPSADGRYIFVACNWSSRVDVVDRDKMKLVASIRCDSYPVGLAVSREGDRVIVTSQGRKGHGGNAVNIFRVEY